MKKNTLKYYMEAISPFFLGCLAFYIVVGPTVLYPNNIGWLGRGDPATHYLGWHFFRHSDWSFPIGLNPNYGLEFSNAIIYSDSIPLFAFLFKLFSALLPVTFQYFGIWLLVCFVLQWWYGWKLVGLISTNTEIRLLGAGLFVFAPPMIFRMDQHLSLAGHFLLLTGLYLHLRPVSERRALSWAVLLATSTMVHAYLLAMLFVLWLTDLIQAMIRLQLTWRRLVTEFFSIIFFIFIICWLIGYFSVGSNVSAGGYGFYKMNLLAFVDPDNWSYVLRDIPGGKGEYEGFNYLGLGVLILAIAGIPSLLAGRIYLWRFFRSRWPLLVTLSGLFLFALTHNVGVGSFQFTVVELGELLLKVANVFRSSGRMAWLVYYAIVFLVILIIIRGNSSRVAALLLSMALFAQIVDTRASWQKLRDKYITSFSSEWVTPMRDSFWSKAAKRYRKVRLIYPGNHASNWLSLAYYAARSGMATDAVYLARVDAKKLSAAHKKAVAAVQQGLYETDSLYILDEVTVKSALMTINRNTDLLAKIDGYYVIAPGWKNCSECDHIPEISLSDLLTPVKLEDHIDFSSSGTGSQYLFSGWSGQEPTGRWSEGDKADIFIPFSGDPPVRIVIEGHPLVSYLHPEQRIIVYVNEVSTGEIKLDAIYKNGFELYLPEEVRTKVAASGLIKLNFIFLDAVRPIDIKINNDTRRLGLFLKAIKFNL